MRSVFTQGFTLDQLPGVLRQLPDSDGTFPLVDERIAAKDGHRRFSIASSQTLKTWHQQGKLNEPFGSHIEQMSALIENRWAPTEKVSIVVESNYSDLFTFLASLDQINANTLTLSSVGMAIGQANWRRLHPESAPPVDIYLN